MTGKKKTDVEVIADEDLDRAVGGAGWKVAADEETAYYRYELKNVQVTSYSINGSGSD